MPKLEAQRHLKLRSNLSSSTVTLHCGVGGFVALRKFCALLHILRSFLISRLSWLFSKCFYNCASCSAETVQWPISVTPSLPWPAELSLVVIRTGRIKRIYSPCMNIDIRYESITMYRTPLYMTISSHSRRHTAIAAVNDIGPSHIPCYPSVFPDIRMPAPQSSYQTPSL